MTRPTKPSGSPGDKPRNPPPTGSGGVDYFPEDAALGGNSAVDAVRSRHERELLCLPGVVGVGVRTGRIGEEAIVLYLREPRAPGSLPRDIEGVPVELEVTGEIDAL